MFFHHGHQQAFEQVYGQPHHAQLTHELLGGAVAFAAMREYEKRQPGGGNHALAKEIIAGLVGAEMDRLIETKGLDYIDRHRAKQHAQQQAEAMFHHEYVSGQGSGGQFFQQYQGPAGMDMGYGMGQGMGPGMGPQGGYGAGYGGPPQMGGPQMGYGSGPQMGGGPQMGWGGSQPGFGGPQMGYGGPQQMGYGQPGYGGPPSGW